MLYYSNAEGKNPNILFSKEEIQQIQEWFEYASPFFLEVINEQNYKKLNNEEPILINPNKSEPYEKSNRLQRAIHFITIARSESFIPAKITFYISALESLLSISNSELRMQVSDRSARILGSTFEERLKVNKLVNIAYSFRSSYIHGAVNNPKTLRKTLKPYASVEELSVEVDSLLRNLIKRFLTDLRYVVDMNDAEFAIWINELLYK